MHIHLFEFEDLAWFPDNIRRGATDYLRYFFRKLEFYKPAISVINRALKETGEHQIIDLCSGGGGAIEQISEGLKKESGEQLKITLTDKYPNLPAYRLLEEKSRGSISYYGKSVDAMSVPAELKGLRTMFTASHHFRENDLKAILRDAVQARAPIAIFDAGDKNLISVLGILVGHPLGFLLWTPFFRPFKVSRLLMTYVLPLIPLMTIWDGLVSVLRLYSEKELLKFAMDTDPDSYRWESGKVKNRWGLSVNYLLGIPR